MTNIGIVIRGTSGGYESLYVSSVSEKDSMSIAYNARLSPRATDAIGRECYGISFSANGKAFTIYRVVYDGTRAGQAVGFLAISIFVPFAITGEVKIIKSLLDKMMEEYCLKYVKDNTLGSNSKDWSFIQTALDEKQEFFKPTRKKSGEWLSGSKDAAYIFYKENNLDKYFENVFQSRYKDFKEVLLIDEKFRGPNNILLAIKHSEDITDEINIERSEYELKFDSSQGIKVIMLGRSIENGETVELTQFVNIHFNKNYYKSIQREGSFYELCKNYPDVVQIDRELNEIIISCPKTFVADTKEFNLIIKAGNSPVFQEIKLKNTSSGISKTIGINDIINFEGEEIGQKWTLEVDGGNEYEKYSEPFDLSLTQKDITIQLVKKEKHFISKVESPQKIKDTAENTPQDFKTSHIPEDPIPQNNTGQSEESGNVGKQDIHKPNLGKQAAIVGILLVLFVLLVIFGIYMYPKLFTDENTETENRSETATTFEKNIQHISEYVKGMELSLDTLEGFKQKSKEWSYPNSTSSQITNAIRLRKAINGYNQDSMNFASINVTHSAPQSILINKIRQDNNFKYFQLIKKRQDLSLSLISNKLDSIINVNKGADGVPYNRQANADETSKKEDKKVDNTSPVIKKVRNYLESDVLKLEELKNYKKEMEDKKLEGDQIYQKLEKTIEFRKFLDKGIKDSLLTLYYENSNLLTEKQKEFLRAINEADKFPRFSNIKKRTDKSFKKLIDEFKK